MVDLNGYLDFSEPCRIGHDTMLSRMFKVLQNYSTNIEIISEEIINYEIKTRKLKVYETNGRNYKSIPQIILQENWLEKIGFYVGSVIRVDCYENKIVIIN